MDQKKLMEGVDLLFCIKSDFENKKIYDWRHLKKNITRNSAIKKWLGIVLDWVQIKDI